MCLYFLKILPTNLYDTGKCYISSDSENNCQQDEPTNLCISTTDYFSDSEPTNLCIRGTCLLPHPLHVITHSNTRLHFIQRNYLCTCTCTCTLHSKVLYKTCQLPICIITIGHCWFPNHILYMS